MTLRFPDHGAPLTVKRAFQTQVLQGIKTLQLRSEIAESEGRELWIAKQRTPEERGRIKAIVLAKEFLERYRATVPNHVIEEPELDWRGAFMSVQ